MTASPTKVTEGEPIAPEESQFPQPAWKIEELDKAEINRLGQLVVVVAHRFSGCGVVSVARVCDDVVSAGRRGRGRLPNGCGAER